MKQYLSKWHWMSKWTACIGIIAIGYTFLFTDSHSLNIVNHEIRKNNESIDIKGELHHAHQAQKLTVNEMPPLEHFTAMVERPLFSPSRRSKKMDAAAEEMERPEPPELPLVRFIGTIDQGGRILALTDGFQGNRNVSEGDEVGGWQVSLVKRRRLVLGRGAKKLELHIFGDASGPPLSPDFPLEVGASGS